MARRKRSTDAPLFNPAGRQVDGQVDRAPAAPPFKLAPTPAAKTKCCLGVPDPHGRPGWEGTKCKVCGRFLGCHPIEPDRN